VIAEREISSSLLKNGETEEAVTELALVRPGSVQVKVAVRASNGRLMKVTELSLLATANREWRSAKYEVGLTGAVLTDEGQQLHIEPTASPIRLGSAIEADLRLLTAAL
jgi:hypothetical protein